VANELAVGDSLEVMPPTGRFHLSPERVDGKVHVGFAAGSGITPILSIIASILQAEPNSRFALFYGNRKQNTTMFIEDLFALKNRFPERLQVHFVFSQEEQEFEISGGRIDADKVAELWEKFCSGMAVDEAWVCGPDSMIDSVSSALVKLGMPADNVRFERFGAPRKSKQPAASEAAQTGEDVQVTVIMDGHKKRFEMPRRGTNIVDAAAEQGIELPYSCKGGVCATCRTHLRSGKVDMATNYGLEPWEVEKGFVLACQSTPMSDEILLDYDKS
jgi:ring-1,2-phenylacetyl-CoA epoxidase subunit PaaE